MNAEIIVLEIIMGCIIIWLIFEQNVIEDCFDYYDSIFQSYDIVLNEQVNKINIIEECLIYYESVISKQTKEITELKKQLDNDCK